MVFRGGFEANGCHVIREAQKNNTRKEEKGKLKMVAKGSYSGGTSSEERFVLPTNIVPLVCVDFYPSLCLYVVLCRTMR